MHRYISENTQVCPRCKKTRKLRSFWIKDGNYLIDICRPCDKIVKEAETTAIVTNLLKDYL